MTKNNLYHSGLSEEEVIKSRENRGRNLITPPPSTPWWRLYLDKFKDPIIIILLVATAITLIIGIKEGDFTESVGIILAILLATGVGFYQEYSAKKKFDAMKNDKDFELVKVRRVINGESVVVEIPKDQIVVADVVVLSAGDEIPADIELISAIDMKVSEAAMTGESVAVAKYVISEPYSGSGFAPNQLLRGTTIEQGMGEGVVVKVGDETEIGKTTRQATEETNSMTPLQIKLKELAGKISVAAFMIAIIMFVVLNLVHWDFGFGKVPFEWNLATLAKELSFLMSAIVVIIVAVPEGLPLSVTLALAFSMKTMAKENNLVKKMHACETIGAVNVIFTDKTGTLTQNCMTVVEKDVQEEKGEILNTIGALNSTANWSNNGLPIGNPTECAILKSMGRDLSEKIRGEYEILSRIPFSSAWKYMVTYAKHSVSGEEIIVIKGAPEVISKIIKNDTFLAEVSRQQDRGRRAISAAVIKEGDYNSIKSTLDSKLPLEKCEYIGTWFIEDPVRSDVPEAIGKCYGAGIDVVMMTGDNFKTGAEIARQAGFENIWAIEAKDFWSAIEHPQNGRMLPNVIARCTPANKLDILKWAQSKGLVCAMTGDGVNDSPSLNYADVGIAMGSGTSVAKEAADIVLLDDAFPSIVTGVKWGRSLYKNIKNFFFLQLSINVSACLIVLFGPLVGVEMPFTVTQFLWINLVMDSLAAIALASEPADERVLKEKPRDHSEFIIDKPLATSIFGFGILVWIVCTFILWGMRHIEEMADITPSMFFAFYMMINWWNLFNARVVGKHKSIFDGLTKNLKFTFITLFVLVTTILIVQFGGQVFQTEPLTLSTWISLIIITSPIVVFKEIHYILTKKGDRG